MFKDLYAHSEMWDLIQNIAQFMDFLDSKEILHHFNLLLSEIDAFLLLTMFSTYWQMATHPATTWLHSGCCW